MPILTNRSIADVHVLRIWSCVSSPGPVSRKVRNLNFFGQKTNFKIQTCWKVAQFLAHKPVNFVSLTYSFIVLFWNYWNVDLEFKHNKHKTAFRDESYWNFGETGRYVHGENCATSISAWVRLNLLNDCACGSCFIIWNEFCMQRGKFSEIAFQHWHSSCFTGLDGNE